MAVGGTEVRHGLDEAGRRPGPDGRRGRSGGPRLRPAVRRRAAAWGCRPISPRAARRACSSSSRVRGWPSTSCATRSIGNTWKGGAPASTIGAIATAMSTPWRGAGRRLLLTVDWSNRLYRDPNTSLKRHPRNGIFMPETEAGAAGVRAICAGDPEPLRPPRRRPLPTGPVRGDRGLERGQRELDRGHAGAARSRRTSGRPGGPDAQR